MALEGTSVWSGRAISFLFPSARGSDECRSDSVDSMVPASLGASTPGSSSPPTTTANGGSAQPEDELPAERKQRIRALDLKRKKRTRERTQALLMSLYDLETEARRREKPFPRARSIKFHTVLEEMVRRLRIETGRQQREVVGGPACEEVGDLSSETVTAGMAGAHSIGMLYVCVEDWVVQRSNRAMELVCPFDKLRGYVGLELSGVVHPDDHLQLELLQQQQANSWKPGDSLVLSVRMLRACLDGGTLVMGWRRQHLEVAHVARDKEHGGKLHVMFTCVLDADSLEPLAFDEEDRRRFQETAAAVSGIMTMDVQRTTETPDVMSQMIRDAGIAARNDSPMADFLSGVSSSIGRLVGIPQLLHFIHVGARSTMNSLLKIHLLLGLAPDGTPWMQKSWALCAFGFMSHFRVFAWTCAGIKPTNVGILGENPPEMFNGVLKPCECAAARGGKQAIGFVAVLIAPTQREEQARRVILLAELGFSVDEEHGAHESSWIMFLDKKRVGALPEKKNIVCARIGPPDLALLERFMAFDQEQGTLENPFPEFARL